MAKISNGLTRRINILADKALLAAFADGTHNIKKKHVNAAAADSEFAAGRGAQWRVALVAAVCLIAAAIAWMGYRSLTGTAAPVNIAERNPPASPAQATIASPATVRQAPPAPLNPAGNTNPIAPTAGAYSDPLELRLSATHEWLARASGNLLSIQLLGSNDLGLLRKYLDELQKSVEPEKIFVYRTRTSSGPSVTLLYGTFSSRAEALQALDALPPEFRINRPYIRTVDGIRLEIGLSTGESLPPKRT